MDLHALAAGAESTFARALKLVGPRGASAPEAAVASLQATLQAVGEASACLVAEPDLERGLAAALDTLRRHTGVQRVFLHRHVAAEGRNHYWLESRAAGALPHVAGFDSGPLPDEEHALPIVVQGRYRACIGLQDERAPRAWTEAELVLLHTVAGAMAGALARHDAEQARAEAEQAHLRQMQDVQRLLEGVVAATRALLSDDDFDGAQRQWLASLGEAFGADRARYGELAPGDARPTGRIDWVREGAAPPAPCSLDTADAQGWTQALADGRTVCAQREELRDPATLQQWQQMGCRTRLLTPVRVDGATAAWLCFEFGQRRDWCAGIGPVLDAAAAGVAAAIQRRAAVRALLAERDRRIALELARADSAASLARRSERHSALLAAVAGATEELLAWPEPTARLDEVLARIGAATQAERACVWRLHWSPEDAQLHGFKEVAHEWARPGVLRASQIGEQRCPMRRDDADCQRALARFATERRLVVVSAELDEPLRSRQRALGVVWSLSCAIAFDGRVWGLLSLDYGSPVEQLDEADLAALQTVASAIADALARQQLEQRTLDIERRRADENARLVALLDLVVRSSRELVDADALEPALRRWLGEFGRHTGAARVGFCDLVPHARSGLTAARLLCEWVAPGVAPGVGSGVPVSFDAPQVIDPRGCEEVARRLASGKAVVLQAEECAAPLRDRLHRTGSATVISVPIFLDGRQWGCLNFDHAERRQLDPGDAAVLQTAADTLAAILKRHESARNALAEREARIATEQRRFSQLAEANDALRVSLDALADAEGEQGFLRQSLLQIHDQAGASGAYLFGSDGPGGELRLLGCVRAGRFSRELQADDPPMFRHGFLMRPVLRRQLVAHGRLLWRRVDPQMAVDETTPTSMRWHLRMGHRANALHLLRVGQRQVGLIGLVFDTDTPPSPAQQELVHTLCQPLTLALELARLAQEARLHGERAAVLGERERMAAEIHDSMAQSFTSIAMQSESLAGRLEHLADGAEATRVLRIIERTAREGLAEARASVLALRPVDGAPGALDAALAELAERSSVHGGLACRFESTGLPGTLSGPVRESLLRIAQEATNNALRHSGGTQLRMHLAYGANTVQLAVEDNGRGLPQAPGGRGSGGYGLPGMVSRAAALGGRLEYGLSALGGLALRIELDCAARPEAAA
jgi:signal transduction histidine kinase